MNKLIQTLTAALAALGCYAGLTGCAAESSSSSGSSRVTSMVAIGKLGDLPGVPGSGDTLARSLGRALAASQQVLVAGISDSGRHDGARNGMSGGPGMGGSGGGMSGGPGMGGPGGGMGGGSGMGGPGGGMGGGPGMGGPGGGNAESSRPSFTHYTLLGNLDRLTPGATDTVSINSTSAPPAVRREALRASFRLVAQATGRVIWKGGADCTLPDGDTAVSSCLAEISRHATPQLLEALESAGRANGN